MKFDRRYVTGLIKKLQKLKRSPERNALIQRLEGILDSPDNDGADYRTLGEAEDFLGMY